MADATETLTFELVSPERLLVSEEIEMVVVPGREGDFGVLPQHSPLISTLRPGVIDIYQGGKIDKRIFVASGFAEVNFEGCTVLAEEAIALDEIDRAGAEERLRDAESDLKDAADDAERAAAERSFEIATLLLDALAQG
jgi:F-type H+-transporting ATPase subunit epsilon